MNGRTWEKSSADHAGHHDEEHGQHLEIGSQDTSSFGMRQRLGRQGPLNYDLHMQTHIHEDLIRTLPFTVT